MRIILLALTISAMLFVMFIQNVNAQPWCGRNEVTYHISITLSYIVEQEGWDELLSNDVIRNAATSWNDVRGSNDLWPKLIEEPYTGWDIYVTIHYSNEDFNCDEDTLMYYDGEEHEIIICTLPFENNYYINNTHVQRVLAHEFGHSLGALHVDNEYALMYPIDNYVSTGVYIPQSIDETHLNGIYSYYCGSSGGGLPSCDQPPYICPTRLEGEVIHDGK